MSQLSDLIRRYRSLPEILAKSAASDAVAVANDLIAESTLRRLERGEDSSGASFSDYSDSYRERRRKRGRQVNFKDYADTGALNASINPTVKSETVGEVVVTIGARGADNNAKLAGAFRNEKRKRGVSDVQANILSPSEKELEQAEEAYARRRERQINILFR